MGSLPITFFADFTSLESYLTEVVLWRSLEGVSAPVTCRACALPPSLTLASFADDFARAHEVAGTLGISLRRPTRVPTSRKAQEAVRFAAGGPGEKAFRLAIHDAYWGRDRDIGRIDLLQELAGEVGLDPVDLKIALDIDRFREDVERDYRTARRLGVVGAPALYIGTGATARALVGLVRPETLVRELARAD